MSNPGKQYWEAVKWVLRYLRGTARLSLAFQRLETEKPKMLQGYVNADCAEELDQQRSTTEYAFTVAECALSVDCKILWCLQQERLST